MRFSYPYPRLLCRSKFASNCFILDIKRSRWAENIKSVKCFPVNTNPPPISLSFLGSSVVLSIRRSVTWTIIHSTGRNPIANVSLFVVLGQFRRFSLLELLFGGIGGGTGISLLKEFSLFCSIWSCCGWCWLRCTSSANSFCRFSSIRRSRCLWM